LPRFEQLGVAASMQPPHTAYTRADGTDQWSRRLGADRARHAWRLRDLRDAGATVALGSDWPIAHYDVRQVLATARRPRGAASARAGLTGLEALEGCTTHAARAAGESATAGRIAPGHRADLTALGIDPAEAPADELAEAPVRLTVTGGHVIHHEQ
ncbi:amidohydrolase family protein, partial [Streptomyces sp. NPDC059862]|uniref:amidohydrolase family protein n=1 Tax=Streptomyces sp. NPDC059862 TaxID=3346975 RepID=UPI00364F4DDF